MKILDQVTNILKASHMARNSDKQLMIIFMQKSGMNLSPQQIETFKRMPSLETVRRTRQLIQEQGKYPADQRIEEERYNKFKEVRHGIQYEDPEALLEKRGYKVLEYGEG